MIHWSNPEAVIGLNEHKHCMLLSLIYYLLTTSYAQGSLGSGRCMNSKCLEAWTWLWAFLLTSNKWSPNHFCFLDLSFHICKMGLHSSIFFGVRGLGMYQHRLGEEAFRSHGEFLELRLSKMCFCLWFFHPKNPHPCPHTSFDIHQGLLDPCPADVWALAGVEKHWITDLSSQGQIFYFFIDSEATLCRKQAQGTCFPHFRLGFQSGVRGHSQLAQLLLTLLVIRDW